MNNKIIFIAVIVVLVFILILFLKFDYLGLLDEETEVNGVIEDDKMIEEEVVEDELIEDEVIEGDMVDDINNRGNNLNGGGIPSAPWDMWIVVKDLPLVNEIGELEMTMMTIYENTSYHVQIKLPEDFLLVEGNLSWYAHLLIPQEELDKHQPPFNESNPRPIWNVTQKLKFKPLKEGNYTIMGRFDPLKPNTTELFYEDYHPDYRVLSFLFISDTNSSVLNFPNPYAPGCVGAKPGTCAS